MVSANNAKRKKLGELVDVFGGGTPTKDNKAYWGGKIPWVSPKDMKSFELNDSTDHITESALQESACKLIPAPSVLFVVRGMILAHTLPVAIARVPVAINQDMKALRPRKGLNPEFLAYALAGASEKLLSQVEIAGHGTRRLKTSAWMSLEVPIPETDEQERIVARAREAAECVAELRRHYDEGLKEAKALQQAILRRVFVGNL